MKKKENIKEDYQELVKQLNNTKYNNWYKLKDLVVILNISYKSLKNMVGKVYEKNNPLGTIRKEGRRYYIHYSILDCFKLKQPRVTTIYSHDWKSNISWTTKDYYDMNYHKYLINHLKINCKGVNFIETIELDKNGRYHTHILADAEPKEIKPIIENLLNVCLDNYKFYRLYCEDVNNIGCSVDYLLKNPQ
jgi:hypothetical protein